MLKGPGTQTHRGTGCGLRRGPGRPEHRCPPAPVRAHLVLQPVPPSPHVHVPGVGVIEAALTQLAVEADHPALLVAHLRHKAWLSTTCSPHTPHAVGLGSTGASSPRAFQARHWLPVCPVVNAFRGVTFSSAPCQPGPSCHHFCHRHPILLPCPHPPLPGAATRKPAWCGCFSGHKTEALSGLNKSLNSSTEKVPTCRCLEAGTVGMGAEGSEPKLHKEAGVRAGAWGGTWAPVPKGHMPVGFQGTDPSCHLPSCRNWCCLGAGNVSACLRPPSGI